jgi:hypothetical protein
MTRISIARAQLTTELTSVFEFVEPVEIRAEVMMVASRVRLHSEFPKTVQDPRRNKLANRHNADCHRTLL